MYHLCLSHFIDTISVALHVGVVNQMVFHFIYVADFSISLLMGVWVLSSLEIIQILHKFLHILFDANVHVFLE